MGNQRSQSVGGLASSHQPGQNETSAEVSPGTWLGVSGEEGMEKTEAEPQISTLYLGPERASTGTGRGEAKNK